MAVIYDTVGQQFTEGKNPETLERITHQKYRSLEISKNISQNHTDSDEEQLRKCLKATADWADMPW